MTAIQMSKPWSINPNVRNAYVSLADMSGWFIYENHAWMIAHGWTVKFTSDGVTGPSGSGDTTDRIINKAAASVRGAVAAAPQSYTVLQSADGVQLLMTFQGASDDVVRLSYSPGGLFTLAGTTTHQPTAADETLWVTATSVVNGTTSADRVMTIWCSDDGRNWCNALYRQGTLQTIIGLERVDSVCSPGVFDQPYIAMKYSHADRITSDSNGGPCQAHSLNFTTTGAASWRGALTRVFTQGAARIQTCGGGVLLITQAPGGNMQMGDSFLSNTPALQAGTMPLLPLFLCNERNVAGQSGVVGTPQDWWVGYASSTAIPARGDFFPGFDVGDDPDVDPVRTNWFVAIGPAMVRPWKNIAVSLQAT